MIQSKKSETNKNSSVKLEIISLTIVVIIAFAVRTFIFELFYVPTGSMRATILEGDYIFSTKYSYGYSIYSIPFSPDIFEGRVMESKPERGDIIIMRPPHNMNERYIKRLIGLPGDKIEIVDDITYINDQPIERIELGTYTAEDGTEYIKFEETLPSGKSFFSYKMKYGSDRFAYERRNHAPQIIEDGHYFFIGDNRDNSGDSRYQLGTVPFRNLIAKGRFIIFSTKEPLWDFNAGFIEQIKRVGVWACSIRWNRVFNDLYE